ncbi:hypothetical protein N6P31_17835 [Pectobacterium betavasculorum]|uniref:TonB C-terminal domain-containing protein n=1 Tax=Pectobacterium betavasculorum TaxID=55207 RepID=A0ABR4UWC3_9GAMM|nr:hypothetical protein [Pectobacterium betavasculorum]KFX18379.1 hypothetical protein JV35_16235 [Pectobacterium betavasculorum]
MTSLEPHLFIENAGSVFATAPSQKPLAPVTRALLPAPPAEVIGDNAQLTITIPISFDLREARR